MTFAKKRTKAYVVPVSLAELTLKDKLNLDKAVEKDYDGFSKEEVFQKSVIGFCQIWRLGDFEGILVTEIIQQNVGKQLWVPLLAGRNFFKNLDRIEKALEVYAKEQGCKTFRCAATREGMQKRYAKRWKEIARIYERSV